MNDNEKLIAEAYRLAITDRISSEPVVDLLIRLAGALEAVEKAHATTDDERGAPFVTDADLDRFEAVAKPICRSTLAAEAANKFRVSDLAQWIIRLVAEVRRLRTVTADQRGA